jgi:RNA polymerase sigma-70 factor (ECF subfamily)
MTQTSSEIPLWHHDPARLRAFRDGRADVMAAVYRTHAAPLERYLHNLARAHGRRDLTQTSAVADCIQEVFMRAFSAPVRQSYDGVRNFGAYLTAIAHNCFVDLLRARRREVLRAPEDLPDSMETSPPADGDALLESELRESIAAYLDRLPDGLKEVYELRFVSGRSQENVSEALGVSRRTLRKSEAHLRNGLRRALSSVGFAVRAPRQRRRR